MDVAKILNKLESPDHLIKYDDEKFIVIIRADDNVKVFEHTSLNESEFVSALFWLSTKSWFTTHMLYCLLSVMAEKTDWDMFQEIRQG
jgi:hypothetical protein